MARRVMPTDVTMQITRNIVPANIKARIPAGIAMIATQSEYRHGKLEQ
jgi:hypothetical protein